MSKGVFNAEIIELAPYWARYRAQNLDGSWYWFSKEPSVGAYAWQICGAFPMLEKRDEPNPEWRNTLQQVNRGLK